jgi:hypothetical protein
LPLGYLVLTEAIDWAIDVKPLLAWTLAAALIVGSAVPLISYYRLPKQGFQQALAYIERHRAPEDDRLGLTLGGKAARYYDPSVVLIEDAAQLHDWIRRSRRPAWIVSTFPAEMQSNAPDLYRWLRTETSDEAEFPGVIGDGTVHVHYWVPSAPARP